MSVRALIQAIQQEVRETELPPARAAALLQQLSALLGNVNTEIRDADVAYNVVLLQQLEAHEKANRARIVAETTPAYRRKREARDTKELVVEMIRSLKYVVRSNEEEMRLSR